MPNCMAFVLSLPDVFQTLPHNWPSVRGALSCHAQQRNRAVHLSLTGTYVHTYIHSHTVRDSTFSRYAVVTVQVQYIHNIRTTLWLLCDELVASLYHCTHRRWQQHLQRTQQLVSTLCLQCVRVLRCQWTAGPWGLWLLKLDCTSCQWWRCWLQWRVTTEPQHCR